MRLTGLKTEINFLNLTVNDGLVTANNFYVFI